MHKHNKITFIKYNKDRLNSNVFITFNNALVIKF